jgi:hypothetical protein
VRLPRERERAVGVHHAGDHGGAPIAREVPHQVIGGDERLREREQENEIVRGVGIPGQRPHRRANHAFNDVAFRERQRVGMRVEDVGAKQLPRIRRQRMRDPRHDPDAPAAVVGIEPAGVVELENVGEREHAREDDGAEHDGRGLDGAAKAHVRR